MLEYSKLILQKVSFNGDLFKKELGKAVKFLKRDEIVMLQIWCMVTFSDKYADIIKEIFEKINF